MKQTSWRGGWTLFLALLFVALTVWGETLVPDGNAPDSNAPHFLSPQEEFVLSQISDLEEGIHRMQSIGLKTIRVSDGLLVAQSTFETEKGLIASGKRSEYIETLRKVEELLDIVDLAFEAKDEVTALQQRLSEVKEEIDARPVEEILNAARIEVRDERYERAIELANEGQTKIVELQSMDTKAKAAAEAATANVASFLDRNKYNIATAGLVFLLLYLVFMNRFRHYLSRYRIQALELERNTLKKEIQRAQEAFFVQGALSETVYNIRIKVFSAMIREVTRKIAVLSESEKKADLFDVFRRFSKKNGKTKNGEGKGVE